MFWSFPLFLCESINTLIESDRKRSLQFFVYCVKLVNSFFAVIMGYTYCICLGQSLGLESDHLSLKVKIMTLHHLIALNMTES